MVDRLDPAILRRFDLKIQFDYPRPDQAGKLFTRVLADFQGYTRPRRSAESVKVRLSPLRTLTPGGFATTVRQARVIGRRYGTEQLLAVQEEECRTKQRGVKLVTGFVSSGYSRCSHSNSEQHRGKDNGYD